MAMTECAECNAQISDQAKACPHCGAKPKRNVNPVLAVAVIAVAALMVNASIESKAPEDPVEHQLKQQAGARYSAVMATVESIKKNLRNPSSVQWVQSYANRDGTLVCLEYRAQNGFGGMERGLAAVTANRVHTSVSDWNRLCTQQATTSTAGFYDVTIR